jgi:hypothetical protein
VASNASVPESSIVSPDRVRSVVQGVLRAAKAEGWTDPQLAELSGVCGRTIKSYRVDGKEPSLSNALSLAVVIGPKALNPVLALIGYVAQPLDEADGFDAHRAVATGLQHFSTIATAAADGRIDHLEAPMCREAADMIIATVMPLSSAADAA